MITVNGDAYPWKEGLTVKQLLDEKNYKFKMISVWIDDKAVDKFFYEDTKIKDGSVVQVIHNISGGC